MFGRAAAGRRATVYLLVPDALELEGFDAAALDRVTLTVDRDAFPGGMSRYEIRVTQQGDKMIVQAVRIEKPQADEGETGSLPADGKTDASGGEAGEGQQAAGAGETGEEGTGADGGAGGGDEAAGSSETGEEETEADSGAGGDDETAGSGETGEEETEADSGAGGDD